LIVFAEIFLDFKTPDRNLHYRSPAGYSIATSYEVLRQTHEHRRLSNEFMTYATLICSYCDK
jgi:hypothetical protein